jgi:hypothetical protein
MKEQFKKFLNEEQDPKAIEKITTKLTDLLMKNEEIGYIGVQKRPAINVFPDSIVLTNKRIILCKPKNLGLSMDFTDYPWNLVAGAFVKENILGSEFSFTTNTDLTVSIEYIPKTQARKIYTFAKEQMELLKEAQNPSATLNNQYPPVEDITKYQQPLSNNATITDDEVEEVEAEEVTNFAEIIHPGLQPTQSYYNNAQEPAQPMNEGKPAEKNGLADLSKEELFDKLQNYKKLLDNGLILQGEYDNYKREILSYL